MKKNNTEKFWWSGLTVEAMKDIDKKESKKKPSAKLEEWDVDGSDIFADVTKSKKKSKKIKKREPWSDPYSDVQYIYKKYGHGKRPG